MPKPPRLTTPATLNLNSRVRVRLLEDGATLIREHDARYGSTTPARVKAGAWYECPLWDAMRLFGPRIGIGVSTVIETDIQIVTPY